MPQINFEDRKIGDIGNDCLLSVDGTDYRLAMNYRREYYSYKFKACGYRYEVGLNIITRDICWWHGPFACGTYNDITIFRSALQHHLEHGERVEADKGYSGAAPQYVKCPGALVKTDPEMVAMQSRLRSRHETCNNRLKKWNILKVPYRHDLTKHQAVFGAIATIVQLSFGSNPLFQVEYSDE